MSGRKVQVRRDAQGIHLDDGVNVRGLNRDETAALEAFFATDHSMCARLVRHGHGWALRHPDGQISNTGLSTYWARGRGYTVPDDHTVQERVADILRELDRDETPYVTVAARLAELGLLAKEEGEA